jgi:hypothetical protein
METRDVQTVTQHVYFDAVRVSLTNQVVAAYIRRTGVSISPLTQSMAGALGIADPIVKKLISPEALSELLDVGWPVTVVPGPPPGTVGITESTIGTIWQIFGNSEYGLARFEVRRHSRCISSNASVLRFGYCSGAGDCHHPSGEYSELAGESASQDPANASTQPGVAIGPQGLSCAAPIASLAESRFVEKDKSISCISATM